MEYDSAVTSETDDLAAIALVREQLADGVRTGKPDRILGTYDESVVLMSPNEPPVIGLEESRIWLEAAFSEPYPEASYETAEIQISDDWAFERGSYWEGSGKRLWIYRRQPDGGWKISHIMWSSNSPKEEPMDMTELNEFARRYAAAWSGQYPVTFASFYAESGSLRINDGEPSVGRDAIAQTAQGFMTAFPDMVVELVEFRQTRDHAEFHWRWTGTNTGPGGTGNAVNLRGFEQWTFDSDGLILESLGHLDDAEYKKQLNAGSENSESEM
jgi:ketosteroid isomerase-like protein